VTRWVPPRAAPRNERADRLALEQLRLVLRNMEPNVWMMPAFALVLCAIFTQWIDVDTLALWFAAVVVASLPGAYVANLFETRRPPAAQARRWTIAAAGTFVLFDLVWISMAVLFWVPNDPLNNMLLVVIFACTLSAAAALESANRVTTAVAFTLFGGTLILLPLQGDGLLYTGLSLLAVLYVFYQFHMAQQIYATARDMLLLREDKNDLIETLAVAKVESDNARDRAEKANRAKSAFLANMSHELRTPLNAILGFSELIKGQVFGPLPVRYSEYGAMIHQSGGHLLGLINDILDLAKIEAGRYTLHQAAINLEAGLEDAVGFIRLRAEQHGVALEHTQPHPLPALYADARAVRQMLINLLSNAVKFTPSGGQVRIFVAVTEQNEIEIGVSDTGVGIAPSDQALVFESFGQARHDTVIVDKGTGLGLTIVKGLAEAHGASVTLASAPGRGTRVSIVFPAERTLWPEDARLSAAS